MKSTDYQAAKPPEGFDLLDLNAPYRQTARQAQEYFSWHQAILQERISYLLNFCSQVSRVPYEVLYSFPDGMVPLWRWFLQIAELVPLTPEARKKMEISLAGQMAGHPQNVMADIVADMIPERVLSTKTEEIIRDIAMYVGDGFIRLSPKLYWELFRKSKMDIGYGQAVINGLTPPGIIPGRTLSMEPIGIVRVQALRLVDGYAKEDDLYGVIKKEWLRGA